MTDSDVTEPSSGGTRADRQPPLQAMGSALQYLRSSAHIEFKRESDAQVAMLLPISCVMLIAAILLPAPPAIKALAFCAPLAAFFYYIATRIGIVKTFSQRQAYLTWHILIATFLLGGTITMMLLFLGIWITVSIR
jgi:hypothetical protein